MGVGTFPAGFGARSGSVGWEIRIQRVMGIPKNGGFTPNWGWDPECRDRGVPFPVSHSRCPSGSGFLGQGVSLTLCPIPSCPSGPGFLRLGVFHSRLSLNPGIAYPDFWDTGCPIPGVLFPAVTQSRDPSQDPARPGQPQRCHLPWGHPGPGSVPEHSPERDFGILG